MILNGNTSACLYIISGVPRGCILGPLSFLIFIYDIDEGIASRLLTFADNTKLVGTVSSDLEIQQLCSDLKQLYGWSIGMLEHSFSRPFVPWNIRSLNRSFPGTFNPGTVCPWNFCSRE